MSKTVFELIQDGYTERLSRLEALDAPKCLLANAREQAEKPPVSHLDEFAEREVASYKWRTGREGRPWCAIILKDGTQLNFFPQARWGAFIKLAPEAE